MRSQHNRPTARRRRSPPDGRQAAWSRDPWIKNSKESGTLAAVVSNCKSRMSPSDPKSLFSWEKVIPSAKISQSQRTQDAPTNSVSPQESTRTSLDERSKIFAFVPVLSQLLSLYHFVLRCNPPAASSVQCLFVQGIVDTFKFFALAHRVPRSRSRLTPDRSGGWMASHRETKLQDLCLPGTHNSHAYRNRPTPTGSGWILCQRHTVLAQLQAGVRLLDFRMNGDGIWFGHGPAETTAVEDVAKDVMEFIRMNPTEVVVCLVKRNGANDDAVAGQVWGSILRRIWSKQVLGKNCDPCCDEKYFDFDGDVPVVVVGGKGASQRLRRRTMSELTLSGSRGLVVVEPWSNWQGSWHNTKGNRAVEIVEDCKAWALKEVPPSTRPRLLEFILTIDAGPVSRIAALGLFHTIESVADILERLAKQDGLFSDEVLGQVQSVFFDYITDEQVQSIIQYNRTAYLAQ